MTTKTKQSKSVVFRQQDLRQYLIDFRDREDVKDGSFDGSASYVHKPSNGGKTIDTDRTVQGICNLMESWADYEGLRQADAPLTDLEGDCLEAQFPDVEDWPLASGCYSFPVAVGDAYHGNEYNDNQHEPFADEQYHANRHEPFAENEYCNLRRQLLDWCIEWLEGKDGDVVWG